jgi:hypothetical protein
MLTVMDLNAFTEVEVDKSPDKEILIWGKPTPKKSTPDFKFPVILLL